MPNALQWRSFWTIAYTGSSDRGAVIVPINISANWVRIEIIFLTLPRPKWYLAGWINQVYVINGRPHLMPGESVPTAPSIFEFKAEAIYQVRFCPVPYLPNSIVRLYRSV